MPGSGISVPDVVPEEPLVEDEELELDELDELKVCVAYELDGEKVDDAHGRTA